MRPRLLIFVQKWGSCGSLDINLMASPSPGLGNRLSGFTRYACESGVGVFREHQRVRLLVPLPYWSTQKCSIWPSNEIIRYLIPTLAGLWVPRMGHTEADEYVVCNSHCSGIMGAAHGCAQEAEVKSRPPSPQPMLKAFRPSPARLPPVRVASRKDGCGWCRYLPLLPG